MEARIENPAMTFSGALEALSKLRASVGDAGIPETTHYLIEVRASQINGCGVCLDMHTRELQHAGEPNAKIFSVAAWREAPYFTDAEIYRKKVSGGGRHQLTHNSVHDGCPDYAPGGKRIAYTSYVSGHKGEIYTMKTDGSGKFHVTSNGAGPSYSLSGKRIAYSSTGGVYTIKTDGSGKHRVTGGYASACSWGSRP